VSDTILLTQQGHIALLTLNDPPTLNSLSLDAIQELLIKLRAVARDPLVRALVVTGAGRGFCAGWQLGKNEVPGIDGETLGVRQSHLMEQYFNPVIHVLHEMPVPVVAAVNGVCAGAGVSIALAADIVLASEQASFVLTFAPRLGLVPDLGASWKLPRLIGWARAQAVTMLGEKINAETAERWGMIWRSVPAATLMTQSLDTATRLAANPAQICREVREVFAAGQLNSLAAQMDVERLRQRHLLDRPSFHEGVKAFEEKRSPNFHGD
jgi:2-(1,2-epoxy-1,2-dihydrophenyl)acetyl-CoA isomerase